MATTLDTLVQRTRRFVRDYPVPADQLSISLTSSATSLTMSDTTMLRTNWVVEIDYETMLVRTIPSGTVATLFRGWQGSTAASHAVSSTVLVHPLFSATEIIDALNAAKDEMYPYVYKPVLDTTLTALTDTYEYTVPNMPSDSAVPMQFISKVELKVVGGSFYYEVRGWKVRRGATPKIQFRSVPPLGATIRVHGFGPFPDFAASADTVDALFPRVAERPLVLGAASRLLSSGEAGRTRQDTGIRDDREAAVRTGSAISLANQLERRFEKDLARAGLPPLPPHLVPVY